MSQSRPRGEHRGGLILHIEERRCCEGAIDFCSLINRRHGNLRLFDFKAGLYLKERIFGDHIARDQKG